MKSYIYNIHELKNLYLDNSNRDNLHTYLNYLLANCCMPTLLKMKPSSLFHINKKEITDKKIFLSELESIINHFDCKQTVLYDNDLMMIITIYNEALLKEVISAKEEHFFLQSLGYSGLHFDAEFIFDTLRVRYQSYKEKQTEFPHEIGIILGYPLKDVRDFISNNGKNFILCGYWKVYHNVDAARIVFQRYQEERDKALSCILSGRKLLDYY